jgi:hypothetical protein
VLDRLGDLLGHRGIEDRDQHRDVLVHVAHHQRDAQHDRVVARHDDDAVDPAVLEDAPDLALVGGLEAVDLGIGGVERLAGLLREIALPDQQHGRHGRPIPVIGVPETRCADRRS